MSGTISADVDTGSTMPVSSARPVVLAGPDRGQDLQVRVSAPERVALIRLATLAYVRTALGLGNDAWPGARETVTATSDPLGRVGSK